MEGLKTCPFCGGKAFVATIEHPIENRPNGYRFHGQILCRVCQASCGTTGFDNSYETATEKAIKAWNGRVNNAQSNEIQGFMELSEVLRG